MKNKQIIVKKNEEKVICFVLRGEKESTYNIEVVLSGEGASVILLGLFLGRKNDVLTFNTKVVHKAARTKSLTLLRGIFFDTSFFSNDGLIHIEKGAMQSDGYFSSKVLLFHDAKGRSVPSLEIDENDLKAGHASTIGRPDPMQLFYLQSRGLSEKEAIQLIVSGFFDEAFLRMDKIVAVHAKKKLLKNII